MIDRAHRFHGRGSLALVYRSGRTIRGKSLSLRYIQNRRTKNWRVAVVVSRKVNKSAVVRNRIRRRIFEVVREMGDRINGSYDLVFVVYGEDLATMPASQLREMVHEQLREAQVFGSIPSTSGDNHAIVVPEGDKK